MVLNLHKYFLRNFKEVRGSKHLESTVLLKLVSAFCSSCHLSLDLRFWVEIDYIAVVSQKIIYICVTEGKM